MSKILLRVDASAIKESSCSRRFFWNVVSGYREKLNTNDVEFGSAFHEFIKVMKLNGGNYAEAIMAAVERFNVPMEIKKDKQYLTAQYLQRLCIRYWDEYVKQDSFETLTGSDGKALVEEKFSFPYYADDQVEVALCGTIDDLCKHKHGTVALRDYKTTSVYKADQYLNGYLLSPQLLFYRLVVRLYARTYPTSLLGDLEKRNIACFIEGVFLRGATQPAEFKRSEVFFFPEQQIVEFEQLLQQRIIRLVEDVKKNIVPIREGMINGACQTVYGHCKFFGACKQPDDIATNHMLSRYFIQRPYNPLTFGDEHKTKVS